MTLKSLKLRDIFQIKQLQVSQFEIGSSNFLINRHFHIPANRFQWRELHTSVLLPELISQFVPFTTLKVC